MVSIYALPLLSTLSMLGNGHFYEFDICIFLCTVISLVTILDQVCLCIEELDSIRSMLSVLLVMVHSNFSSFFYCVL